MQTLFDWVYSLTPGQLVTLAILTPVVISLLAALVAEWSYRLRL